MSDDGRHCCERMDFLLEEGKVPLNYSDKIREYYTYLKRSGNVLPIKHCPWCGKKFRESLRHVWEEILSKEHGISDPYSLAEGKSLPEGFDDDSWWLERGL